MSSTRATTNRHADDLWRRSSRRLCRRGACLPFLAKWPKGRERVWTGDGPEVVSFFWPHLPVGHPFLEVDICTGAQTNLWRQVHGPLPTAVKQVPDEYRPTILMAVFGNLSTAVWNISDLLVIAFLLPSLSSWQERSRERSRCSRTCSAAWWPPGTCQRPLVTAVEDLGWHVIDHQPGLSSGYKRFPLPFLFLEKEKGRQEEIVHGRYGRLVAGSQKKETLVSQLMTKRQ